MSNYIIGDIQGCFYELLALLDKISYDKHKDQLWFVGDLVNRGPNSLDVLRFVSQLPNTPCTVLGNHDLHLLAVYYEVATEKPGDTLSDLLKAPDVKTQIDWLRRQPLLIHLDNFNISIVHAGIAPTWSLTQAQNLAQEVETILKSEDIPMLLEHMYGNAPAVWQENLTGYDRFRFVLNAFTRMRYCYENGKLELSHKGKPGTQPTDLLPWFAAPNKIDHIIAFGHWASLNGETNIKNRIALDTGCVWGRTLTALRLEDRQFFSVARQNQ